MHPRRAQQQQRSAPPAVAAHNLPREGIENRRHARGRCARRARPAGREHTGQSDGRSARPVRRREGGNRTSSTCCEGPAGQTGGQHVRGAWGEGVGGTACRGLPARQCGTCWRVCALADALVAHRATFLIVRFKRPLHPLRRQLETQVRPPPRSRRSSRPAHVRRRSRANDTLRILRAEHTAASRAAARIPPGPERISRPNGAHRGRQRRTSWQPRTKPHAEGDAPHHIIPNPRRRGGGSDQR